MKGMEIKTTRFPGGEPFLWLDEVERLNPGIRPIGYADLLGRLPKGVGQDASCLARRIGSQEGASSKARRSRADRAAESSNPILVLKIN